MYPIFWLLKQLYDLTQNFGVAIILLTVVVRAVLFPIAQKQFASMAQMRAVQPKMKALQDRYKDDKPRLQQEMAKLYKEEKVNPLAGCRSEEHTSELQSRENLVCRLLLEKKKTERTPSIRPASGAAEPAASAASQ